MRRFVLYHPERANGRPWVEWETYEEIRGAVGEMLSWCMENIDSKCQRWYWSVPPGYPNRVYFSIQDDSHAMMFRLYSSEYEPSNV